VRFGEMLAGMCPSFILAFSGLPAWIHAFYIHAFVHAFSGVCALRRNARWSLVLPSSILAFSGYPMLFELTEIPLLLCDGPLSTFVSVGSAFPGLKGMHLTMHFLAFRRAASTRCLSMYLREMLAGVSFCHPSLGIGMLPRLFCHSVGIGPCSVLHRRSV
jgi:hypothetical protein